MTLINGIGPNGMTVAAIADKFFVKDTPITPFVITPSGGNPDYTGFTAYQGSIPTGLTVAIAINGLSATVSGTPTVAQASSDIKFLIGDQDGGVVASGAVSIRVSDDLTIANGLDSATTLGATKSSAFSYQLVTAGGRAPITWVKTTGTYPAGMTAGSDGEIDGTPTAVETQVLTFTGTDADGQTAVTANVTIDVADVVAVTQGGVSVTEGVVDGFTIVATGGTEPVVYAIDSDDTLPDGMYLIQDGRSCTFIGNVVSGSANHIVNVTATDANLSTDTTGNFTITTT